MSSVVLSAEPTDAESAMGIPSVCKILDLRHHFTVCSEILLVLVCSMLREFLKAVLVVWSYGFVVLKSRRVFAR